MLNKKDLSILKQLKEDSRSSLTTIGRKTRMSKQVVKYRLKILEEQKIIKMYLLKVNFSALGFTQYKLYFKFNNLSHTEEENIHQFWNRESIVWIGCCRGTWDLAISILARNAGEVGRILDEFNKRFGTKIERKNLLITQESIIFGNKEFTYGAGDKKKDLQQIEHDILRLISTDARRTFSSIATTLKTHRDTIKYHYKKLEKEGIIVGGTILEDYQTTGKQIYKILMRFHSTTPETERRIQEFTRNNEKGIQYLKLMGSWDAEVEIETSDEEELYNILNELKTLIGGSLRDYEVLKIYKTLKYDFYPF